MTLEDKITRTDIITYKMLRGIDREDRDKLFEINLDASTQR